jgi:hypothetical protein
MNTVTTHRIRRAGTVKSVRSCLASGVLRIEGITMDRDLARRVVETALFRGVLTSTNPAVLARLNRSQLAALQSQLRDIATELRLAEYIG